MFQSQIMAHSLSGSQSGVQTSCTGLQLGVYITYNGTLLFLQRQRDGVGTEERQKQRGVGLRVGGGGGGGAEEREC